MGGIFSRATYVALVAIFAFTICDLLGNRSAWGQEPAASVGQEIDISNPPAHLKKTMLMEFLRKRQLKQFPNRVDEIVKQMIYADASPVRAFIPRGRSAQSNNTDETNPRILITSHSANKVAGRYPLGFEDYLTFPGSDYEGRLYFGFAKSTSQGESLSWNRITNKFDYFVITGVGDGNTPKVFEVTNRENCTKCHQNEAPIFSLPPWSETITHDPMEPKKPPFLTKFATDPPTYLKDGVLITSLTTPVANNNGLANDSASGAGNRLIQASRIVRNACGMDLNCRRFVLMSAMANPNQSSYLRKNFVKVSDTGNDAVDLDFVQGPMNNLQALITANTIPTYLDGFMEILKPKWPGDNFSFIAQLLPDMSTVISGVTPPLQADPLTPRGPLLPLPINLAVAYFYDVTFEALGFNLQDTLRFQALTLATRMEALGGRSWGRIPDKVRPLLTNWPPTREAIMAFYGISDSSDPATVVAADHENDAPANLSTPTTEAVIDPIPTSGRAVANATPVNATVAAPAANATQSLAHFQKYCLSCHGDPGGDTPFIPFTDPNALTTYNTTNRSNVANRLSRGTMPPRRAPQPTAAERAEMLAFFNRNGGTSTATPAGPVTTSYLGVRVQNTTGIKSSYFAGSPIVTLQKEGYSTDCGVTFREDNGNNPGALKAALTGDKKVYLSPENFPHYFIGNVIEVAAYQPRDQACYPLGVTRNGGLVRMGFNNMRGVMGSVPLQRDAQSPNVALLHVAGTPDRALAVGRDGNIYQLVYPSTGQFTYSLYPVTVRGIPNAKWMRVGFKGDAGNMKIIAETMEGRRVSFSATETDEYQLTLRWEAQDMAVVSSDFIPNLLDRDSVILNPTGSLEKVGG
jgi:mono/diheme cytochrome c family protein